MSNPYTDGSPTPPLLALRDVQKRYRHLQVLEIESLTIRSNEAIWLTGDNGSGKSTLLRILAGITLPTRGRVERSPNWRVLRIGYVPQRGGVYPNLTVAENLRLRARLFDRELDNKLAGGEVVQELGIGSLLDTPVSNLSGGYAHLCAIAAALCSSPEVLLFDEPFAGLDDDRSHAVLSLVSRMRWKYQLLVVVDHEVRFPLEDFRKLKLVRGRLI